MSERCHNDSLDTADDVCGSCYGSYCSDCLVTLRTKPHPICKECALILSGVRGTRKPKILGDRRTVKQRRELLKATSKPEDGGFKFFDDKRDQETSTLETVGTLQDSNSEHNKPLEKVDPLPFLTFTESAEITDTRAHAIAPPQPSEKLIEIQEPVEAAAPIETQPGPVEEFESDAIEEFDAGETTTIQRKKNDHVSFAKQVEKIPEPEANHTTIEKLAASASQEKKKETLQEPTYSTPISPKEYIKLGTFDEAEIDLANTSYTHKKQQPKPTVNKQNPTGEQSIREQLDAMPEPPSHRRLHQKEDTAEVPAVLNNVHPSELQREDTFESQASPQQEKVEVLVGAPQAADEETDGRGVVIPPALRGKNYSNKNLPRRRKSS